MNIDSASFIGIIYCADNPDDVEFMKKYVHTLRNMGKQVSGDVEGWSGDTIFKLDNGQIWQQAEYDYTYFYEYHPDVTIYQTSSGCRMKVEDESDTVIVKRIK